MSINGISKKYRNHPTLNTASYPNGETNLSDNKQYKSIMFNITPTD
jgi:hypothetical protein